MNSAPIQIMLGRIIAVYGLRGWVKIYSECRPREKIFTYRSFYVKHHSFNSSKLLTLKEGQTHGKGLIACFSEINSRDEAMQFVGTDLYIPRDTLPILPESEYYWVDLIHMQVINQQHETIGIVHEILETGANDVLVVHNDKHNYLIPFVMGHYIQQVDLKNRVIYVDWHSQWYDD